MKHLADMFLYTREYLHLLFFGPATTNHDAAYTASECPPLCPSLYMDMNAYESQDISEMVK